MSSNNKQRKYSGNRFLIKVTVLGSGVLLAYCLITYNYVYNMLLERLDEKLYLTAIGARNILNAYPEIAVNPERIPPDYFDEVTQKLTNYASESDTTYIYTVGYHNDEVVFTSTTTLESEKNTDLEVKFMDVYDEASEGLTNLFTSPEETEMFYETLTDKWGEFRSLLLLEKDRNNNRQYIAIDIPLDELETAARKSFFTSLTTALYFGGAVLVVSMAYQRVLKKRLSADSASGFPNANALEDELLKDNNEKVLAVVGCIGLPEIETLYGQKMVDNCIIKILEHLSVKLGHRFTVFRISFSRMAILSKDRVPESRFAALLKSAPLPSPLIETPFINISIKVGIAKGVKSVLNDASLAEISIRNSRTDVVIYSDDSSGIREKYENNILMSSQVNNAFREDRFIPFFQPIVSAKTGEVVKYEALARLRTQGSEVLTPYFFLPFIKDNPLSKKLAQIIFEKCRDKFQNTNIKWSFNINASDMSDPNLSKWLLEEIKKYPTPNNITLEILETEAITDYAEMSNCIERYHELGVLVYMDDFGTGYSNYSHFLKMNIDGLKIDGSLVKETPHDKEIRMFIDSLVKFTKSMDMIIVTEYVENEEILDIMTSLGVDLLQGYYFSEPVSGVEKLTHQINS